MSTNKLFSMAEALCLAMAFMVGPCPMAAHAAKPAGTKIPKRITMSKGELMNKIKGGWAGQTIGVTYGGPTEFKYRSQIIDSNVQIPWGDPDYVFNTMTAMPWLYDDIYMDLTFVEVFDRLGVDAPIDSLANAFANADYSLWHANQAARYNILHGINPPASGYWKNNPHADDIDYQIEADYAGLMTPAMPNAASEISDRVGHIMNYGDGWYGGVYMGAMYSLAFVSQDIEFIVTEALKCIPARSKFHRCISDVIATYHNHPDDWQAAWRMCHERYNDDVACDEGALDPLNIDATINSAYVVIGLLYGGGDFGRTLEISTRCGQDSDCNPASAGGILGTAMGYDAIPPYWLNPLKKAEHLKFSYTNSSLNDTYRMSFNHALEMIKRNGGQTMADAVTIRCQRPRAVRFEQSFPGLKPTKRISFDRDMNEEEVIEGECAAIVFRGEVHSDNQEYIAQIEVEIDGRKVGIVDMPASYVKRNLDVYWNFDLMPGRHKFKFRWLNPGEGKSIHLFNALLLSNTKK